MSCEQCGSPTAARLCEGCAEMRALEGRWGVPEDHIDDGEGA
jgi:hypothetical protein